MSDRTDAYLATLDAALTVGARHRRRIIEETRDHLRDAATRLESVGLAPAAAEAQAIADFGTAAAIARAFDPAPTPARVASTIALHVALVAAFAMITLGLSGALAGAIGLVAGPDAVSGAAPEGLTATDCARLAVTEPGAATCTEAWSWHALEESVLYRVLAGALGAVVGIAALAVARRHLARTTWARRTTRLSALTAAVAFTALCALASAGALGLTTNLGLFEGFGPGWWLSLTLATANAAIVSAAAYAASKRGVTLAG